MALRTGARFLIDELLAQGCWAETVETTDQFAPALARTMEQPCVRLLHLKTDVEQITPATPLTALGDA